MMKLIILLETTLKNMNHSYCGQKCIRSIRLGTKKLILSSLDGTELQIIRKIIAWDKKKHHWAGLLADKLIQ